MDFSINLGDVQFGCKEGITEIISHNRICGINPDAYIPGAHADITVRQTYNHINSPERETHYKLLYYDMHQWVEDEEGYEEDDVVEAVIRVSPTAVTSIDTDHW